MELRWALFISPLHQVAAWLLILANLSLEGSKGSAARALWTGARPVLYLDRVSLDKGTSNANQVSLTWMIFRWLG